MMKKLLLLLVSLVVALGLNAAEYGKDKNACPVRYTVTSGEVVVRAKTDMKAKRVRTISGGDIVYVDKEERIAANGVQWVRISGEEAYIPVRMLTVENNPNYVHKVVKQVKTKSLVRFGFFDLPRWLAWTLLSVWIALAFALCLAMSLGGGFPRFGGVCTRPYFSRFIPDSDNEARINAVYGLYGMRKILFFNKEPYLTFLYIALIFLITFVVTILLFMLIGGLIWGACWVGKILLVILYWLILIGGYGGGAAAVLYAIFGGDGCLEKIVGVALGGVLIAVAVAIGDAQDAMYNAGTVMVGWGNKVFEVFNVFSLSLYIIKTYWFTALLIAVAPLALFLVCAILFLSFAGILILWENARMKRFNIENPCPICGKVSEPAIYLSHGVDHPLPVHLHPGVWGLFHIVHPATGEKMPTLFHAGKSHLRRRCASCGAVIDANVGTERHLALAGVSGSGKSTLLHRTIAEMLRLKVGSRNVCSYTDEANVKREGVLDFDVIDSMRKDGGKLLDAEDRIVKTGIRRMRSVQLNVANPHRAFPYRLFVNDVAGEVFSVEGENKEISAFLLNTDVLVLVIDPFTLDPARLRMSDRMSGWMAKNVSDSGDEVKQDILEAAQTLVRLSKHYGRGKQISLFLTLGKIDSGYLNGIDKTDAKALEMFVRKDLGMGNVIQLLQNEFKDITYHAVSATEAADKSGITAFVADIFRSLGISFDKVTQEQLAESQHKTFVANVAKVQEEVRYRSYRPKSPYSEHGMTIGIVAGFLLAIASLLASSAVNKSIQQNNYAAVIGLVDTAMKSPLDYDKVLELISAAIENENLSQDHLNNLAAKASAVKTEKMRYVDSMMSVLYSNIESIGGRTSNVEISAKYGAIDNLKEIQAKIDELLKVIPSDTELQGYIGKFEKILRKYKITL